MEASDVASGAPTETMPSSSEQAVPQQGESIAAIMAREGRKTGLGDEEINPIRLNSDGSWETKIDKSNSPVVPAKEEDNSNAVNQEASSINTEAAAAEPQKEEQQISQLNWQEAIQSEQPESVLRALGFDEKTASFIKELQDVDPKMVAFLNHWKQGGDLKEYFAEISKDYSTMPVEDVMRHQLRLDYPKASEAQLEVLYKKEIVEKYNLSSYDEDEVAEGKMLLEAKAEKYRDDLSRMQSEKLLPNAPNYNEEQMIQDQLISQFQNKIVSDFNENPYTKDVVSKNAITIGEGADKFTFPVDAKDLTNLAINGDTTGELMFERKVGEHGNEVYVPKAQHQLLVATVNKYGEKFITELAKHYKALGSKAAIEPIENAKPIESRNSSVAGEEPKSVAGAMAKYGKLNSGGW